MDNLLLCAENRDNAMKRTEIRDIVPPNMLYNYDRPRQVYELALLGATQEEMATVMKVPVGTLGNWLRENEEIIAAYSEGSIGANAKVAESLFKCAIGFEYVDEIVTVVKGECYINKIKRFKPADPWAAAKWLSLRRSLNWSETHKVEITNTNININKLDFSGMTTDELKLMSKIGIKALQENVNIDNGENADN